MSPLDILLARADVRPNPGASDADIAAAEGRLGFPLPEPVRGLYRRADGAAVGRAFQFLTLAAAAPYARVLAGDNGSAFGFFPLTEANDSNPYCVAGRSPLAGHVVHVVHDDTPALAYRSLDEFAAAAAALPAGAGVEDLRSPFEGPDRTADDRRVGREAVAFAAGLDPDGPDIATAYHLAVALLGATAVPDLAGLLGHPSEYVRRSAENRLTAIGTPEATDALRAYRRAVADFAQRVVAELRAAGIEAAVEQQSGGLAVLFGPRRSGLNHAMMYRHRDEPDGMARIVERVRQLLALPANR